MTNNDKQHFTSFVDTLKRVSLSTDEKTNIRHSLEEYIDDNASAVWFDYSRLLSPTIGRLAVSAAVMLFVLGGLTHVAENALPGNPLYTIKTNVNETFISLTALSSSRSAQTQSELAARRINELQTLITNNNLTTTTSENLLSEIAAHTKTARKKINDLRSESRQKEREADQLSSRLKALLAVESQALRKAAESASSSESVGEMAQRAAQQLITIAEVATSTTIANSDVNLPTESAVLDLLAVTTDQFSATYNQYREANDPSATPPPQQLVSAAHALEAAVDNVKDDAYAEAVSQLESVLKETDATRSWLEITSSTTTATGSASTTNPTTTTGSKAETKEGIAEVAEKVGTSSEATNATGTPSAADQASTTTATTSVASSSAVAAATGTQPDSEPTQSATASRLPTKQSLHNQTIQSAIETARDLLSTIDNNKATETKTMSSSTPTTTSSQKTDDEPNP